MAFSYSRGLPSPSDRCEGLVLIRFQDRKSERISYIMQNKLQVGRTYVALLMTLICLLSQNRISVGSEETGTQQCYKPSMEFHLYFVSKNDTRKIKEDSVHFSFNFSVIAILEKGILKTSYSDQIFRLENTDIGLRLIYNEALLDVRGIWSANIMQPNNETIKHRYSETVEILKPTYSMRDATSLTLTGKEEKVLLPFSYKATTDNLCSEFYVPTLTWFKINSTRSFQLATRLSTDHSFKEIFLKEYIGRLIVDNQTNGSIWLLNPMFDDTAKYELNVRFDRERIYSTTIDLTFMKGSSDFEFRLAVLIHTQRKADSLRATAYFRQAVRSLTSNFAVYRSYNIIPFIYSGPCTYTMASRQIIDVWMKQYLEQTLTIDAIRGFLVNDCNQACDIYDAFASILKTPIVTFGCTSNLYITDPNYSTLTRTVATMSHLADAFYQLLMHFQWTRLAIVSTITMKMESAAVAFHDYMSARKFAIFRYRVNTLSTVYVSSSKEIMEAAFKAVKESYRIVLLLMEPRVVVEFLSAVRPRFDTDKFVFLIINNQFESDYYFSDRSSELMLTLQEGVISASIKPRARSMTKREANSHQNVDYPWAGYMDDAVQLLIGALHKEYVSGPTNYFNNSNAFSYTRGVNLTGEGTTMIDENGMGTTEYRFQMIQSGSVFDISNHFMVGSHTPTINFGQTSKIEWPNKIVPKDIPCQNSIDCDDEESQSQETSFSEGAGGIVTYIFIAAALCLLIFIIFFMIRRQMRYSNAVQTLPDWIIPWAELENRELGKQDSITTLSTTTESFILRNANGEMDAFIDNAIYRGSVVAIKELDCTQIDISKKENIVDIAEIRSLNHDNINPFIGVCVVSPHVAIVMLYAARGSIDDLLQTKSHCFHNFDLLASLLLDIASGMMYLHRSVIVSHGHLKSTNCVVDERWTCRITDYGMGHIRNCNRSKPKQPEIEDDDYVYSGKLWTAPELLRMKNPPLYGTKKGDVYSFGIIMQEVLLMDVPYALNMEINVKLTAKDIITNVRDVQKDTGPYRPILPKDCCSDVQWLNLTKVCWHENPSERPSFHHIRDEIVKLANFEKMDFVDKTLLMLEEYHVNLQGLVQRREEKLRMEKEKTEDLVYSLIPREMAKLLESGEAPAPTSFDSITVYYSVVRQLIAYTAEGNTPHQVILLMNTICNSFDTITSLYDVQKIDSIGDTYVVAGGLNPNKKSGQHYAEETATLALHLLASVKTLKIPDISNKYIKIRIGIHTGSVVAGVFGTNRMRYSIFGETLHIAAGIQAMGEENRIIISAATEYILRTSGNFHLQSRGRSEVIKGKTMETFFLFGKTGFFLNPEEFTSAAYLPRSPYLAARDRKQSPFASGKPTLPPAVADIIPPTVASPPRIPDIAPPTLPNVPIAEVTPLAERQPSLLTTSEHLNLLEHEFKESDSQSLIRQPDKAPSSESDFRQSTQTEHTVSRLSTSRSKGSLKRHTVVYNPDGFTYTFLSDITPEEDNTEKPSEN